MVAISSSQKKTAFAVILLALIAVGVMISGRGGFSGLRSDAFNNPSFVCSEATQTADKEKYDRSGADIQNFSAEKAGLQTKIQGWNADIRKNDAQIKKLEKEETAAEKKERALEVAVKKHCTPRALATCAARKQELQDVRQEIKQIRNSLVSERNQNKNIRTNIQSAESNIKLLEKQILEIQNFKADYETCKKALENPVISNEICEVKIDETTYRLDPCSLNRKMLDGDGDLGFSFQIIPSKKTPGSFQLYGTGEGLPTYAVLGGTGGGWNGDILTSYLRLNDEVLLPNEEYVGYLPVMITNEETGTTKELRFGLKIKVIENTNPPRTDFCSVSIEGKKYSLDPCEIDTVMQDNSGDKEFSFKIISDDQTFGFGATQYVGFPEYSIQNLSSGGATSPHTQFAKFQDSRLDKGLYKGYIVVSISDRVYNITKEMRLYLNLEVKDSDDKCNNITGIQTTVPAGTAQNSAGGCVCANGGTNPPTCTVEEPTCTNLTVSPTSLTNGGNITYTCNTTNIASSSVTIVFYRPDGSILFSVDGGALTPSADGVSASTWLPATTGIYTAKCFVNGQTTTPAACQKTINNIQPSTPVDTFTVSLDGSTPLNKILLDNTSEHTIAVFRLAAPNTENLDVDSIKITDDGTNGNDVVASYKFYNGATLLGTATPDGDGNAEVFLADGTLVIPANDYKLVTVKAVLRDIDGTGVQNGDTLRATIANIGDIKTTGTTSGNSTSSTQTNISGNIMTVYEAYPIVSFAPDTGGISTAINLGANQLIAKIAITNPGNKDVTFQSGDGNKFAVRIKTFGDDTNADKEVVTLKDQDGTTLDTGTIKSGTGEDQIDFNMSSVGATVGTTIPAGQTKYFYIYADTSDLEDNGNQIQVWLDDNAADVTFGINGTGAYAVGDFVFRGDLFGPVLSRSF